MPAMLSSKAFPAEESVTLWMLPLSVGFTFWHVWSEMAGSWCRMVLSPAHHAPPEGHSQLSVPEPIELEGERDLFA